MILAHPSPKSFNRAIADAAAEAARKLGCKLAYHDLYQEKFDPVMPAEELAPEAALPEPIAAHVEEICLADAILIVHPNWWSQPPAILRGWTDRVLRAGKAYRFVPDGKGGAKAEGLLKARVALVFNTANTPQEKEVELYGDPLDTLWRKVVFGLCGVPRVVRRNFSPIIVSTPEQRAAWLRETAETVEKELRAAV